jgi:ribonucleoside-triphosphate reductase
VIADPSNDHTSIVKFPVKWDVDFLYDHESALDQLERYRMLMNCYVDHNCSITVSYDETEVEGIKDWLYKYWDEFVGVSWMPRINPELTAKDLGFPYLPQEVVTKEVFEEYSSQLGDVDLTGINIKHIEKTTEDECDNGACPVI